MVTKKRHRLGPQRVENLLVLKENRKLLEEFKQNSSMSVDVGDDAFRAVVLEANTGLVPISAIFDNDDELVIGDERHGVEIYSEEDSTDDEFEVVFDSV